MENGEVNIKFNSTTLLTIDNVNKIIKDYVDNIVLKKIRDKIKQSGYNYIEFEKIQNNEYIKINDLQYTFIFNKRKPINVQSYIGCLSSLFNVISGDIKYAKDEIELIYKRVNVFIYKIV